MRRSHVPRQIARTTILLAVLTACTEQPSKKTVDQAVASWSLNEDLRIGGADSGPASFSKVHSVVESPNGNVFVLELQDQELRVFDKRGTFMRVAARRGAGPGELEYATGMALGPDAVVVNDPSQGRYTLVDFNGHFLRHTLAASSGYGDVWQGAVDSLGRIIDFPVRTPIGGKDARTGYARTEDRVRIIHPDGRADTVGGVTCGPPAPAYVYRMPQGFITSYIVPFTANPQTVVTARGTVWCAPMSTYRLLQAPLGQPLRTVVSQQVPLISVPAVLRDSLERQYLASANKTRRLIDDGGYRIPTTYPALQRIDVDDHGRVWVRRNSDTTPAPIDVFDANGTHIASVRVSRSLGDRLFIARQHLYDIQLDGDDVPVVVRYRIDRQ
jgi:hypothetical protein